MLKNIKSIYFIRILFSYFSEKNKLELIKCNKNIQRLLNIDLINYIFFACKFIIFETKSDVKEYKCFDKLYEIKLIYEGEYLNGKRNEKGKEYDYNIFKCKKKWKRKRI